MQTKGIGRRSAREAGEGTCQHTDARPALPVPDPDGLVITGRDHPGVFLVELHCPDVVQVPKEGEQTSSELVVPDLRTTRRWHVVPVQCLRRKRTRTLQEAEPMRMLTLIL